MSALARFLAVISALALAALAGGALWMLWRDPAIDVAFQDAFRAATQLEFSETGRWIATAAAAGVLTYALLQLASSVWPSRDRTLELRAGERDSVRIAPGTLEHELEDIVRESNLVTDADVDVRADGSRSVALDVAIDIPHRTEVATVVADVQERLADALRSQYGIEMARKPRIEVRYSEGSRGKRRFLNRGDRDARVESDRKEPPAAAA